MEASPLDRPATLLVVGASMALATLLLLLAGRATVARWLGPLALAVVAAGALDLQDSLERRLQLDGVPRDPPSRRARALAWTAGAGAFAALVTWTLPATFGPLNAGLLGVLLATAALTAACLGVPLLLWVLDGVWVALGREEATGPLLFAGAGLAALLVLLLVRGFVTYPVPSWLLIGLGVLVPGAVAIVSLLELRRSTLVPEGPRVLT